ncbi:hypothetical protein L1049_011519 [Liquidambar formosana]|uniref:Homeobox domain-containing protein n=1 Tax=Liquidambar formosana TaxID=63359 RepID=A0AAP0X2B2_LIQFO
MEDAFNPFHVPQQSRRDKLRVTIQNNQQQQQHPTTFQLTSPYDPSLLTPNTITSPNPEPSRSFKPNPEPSGSFTTSSSSNPNQFLYMYQSSFHGGDAVPATGQGLSLSLSSHHRHHYLPSQLNPQRYASVSSDESLKSLVPLGPFTGYASVLNRSKFLKPAQQLLDGFCGVDFEMMVNSPLESVGDGGIVEDSIGFGDRVEHRWKNSGLVLLLDEVYKRYKLYCQQMQSVVASFETVAGLGNAAPYISFAFKAMSKHFSCLKNAILDQIQYTGKTLGYDSLRKDKTPRLWTGDQGLQSQKPVRKSAFLQHPVWRSQRGLPDHAVAVLKSWLFEHFLHPYPSDSDKQMLAQQTGLSRSQVSNWFINARVRIWKPMVEEIHLLETRQAQIPPEAENQNANQPTNHHQPLANSLLSEKLFWNIPANKAQDFQSKRSRNEPSNTTEPIHEEQMSFSYGNLSSSHDIGVSRSKTAESSGVSLALGLHQNNGIGLPGPFSMNIAHHFNPETNYEVYLRNSFEAQNRHLRKNLGG